MRKVYILHTKEIGTGRDLWLVFDGKISRRHRSKKKAIEAWIEEFGKIDRLVSFRGIMRPSEAAMTMSDIKIEAEAKEEQQKISRTEKYARLGT